MFKISSIVFIVSLLCVCKIARADANRGVCLYNTSNKIIHSYYSDNSVSFGHPVNLSSGDSIFIATDNPLTLFIADGFQTLYLLKPGKKYTFYSDRNRDYLNGNDENDNDNKELHFFEKLISATGPLRSLQPVSLVENDYNYRQGFIRNLYDRRMNYLNSNVDSLKEKSFYDLAKSFIISYFIRESISFPSLSKSQKKAIVNSYLPHLDTFKSIMPVLIEPYYYPIRESGFSYYKLLDELKSDSISFVCKVKTDTTALKQFYLANKLAKKIQATRDKSVIDSLDSAAKQSLSISSIKDEIGYRIADKYTELKLGNIKKSTLIGVDSTLSDLQLVLKDPTVNLFYIDFWASWCEPCTQEFKYFNKQKAFFEKEKIKYVFISLDNSYRQWKKTVLKNSDFMSKKNSLLLLSNFDSEFASKYKISSIPRYMIVNSKGKILDANAPRPSSNDLVPVLQKMLNASK